MYFEQFYLTCLAHASYMIGSGGEAAVVDPQRDVDLYLEKLTAILQSNHVKSITVAKMEVPCCSGLLRLAEAAVEASGKDVPVSSITIGLSGELLEDETTACCSGH